MKNASRGFTLIELLVCITIVGILTSIALPQYRHYRARAFDAVAQSDLRSIALAEEAYYLDNEAYFPCAEEACLEMEGLVALSSGVTVSVAVEDDSFIATSQHARGSGKVFRWDSQEGGLVP